MVTRLSLAIVSKMSKTMFVLGGCLATLLATGAAQAGNRVVLVEQFTSAY